MIKIAICDDMNNCLIEAKDMIMKWKCPDEVLIKTYKDADALMNAHASMSFDMIFLDVIMPLLNGLEAAKELRQNDRNVKIVFLTTSTEYALDAYSVKADNYLLKPLKASQLYECLDTLYTDITTLDKTITVKTNHAIHRILLRNIEYIEAQNKQISFVLSDGTELLSVNPLYTYEDQLLLKDGFFKCHRSYIVNLYKIRTYTQKELIMRSGHVIPISRSCRKEFENAYFTLLFEKAGDL